MRGSWPALTFAGAAFLVAFGLICGRSSLLALERDRAVAARLAAAHGLVTADVQALRWALASDDPERVAATVAAFAQARHELGDPLAAVAVFGDAVAAQAARAGAGDAAAAWAAFRTDPAALPGLLFLQVRDRFAARTAAR